MKNGMIQSVIQLCWMNEEKERERERERERESEYIVMCCNYKTFNQSAVNAYIDKHKL